MKCATKYGLALGAPALCLAALVLGPWSCRRAPQEPGASTERRPSAGPRAGATRRPAASSPTPLPPIKLSAKERREAAASVAKYLRETGSWVSLEPLVEQMGREKVLAGLIDALGSDDANVRYRAMRRILAEKEIADRRVVPAAQATLGRMAILGGDLREGRPGRQISKLIQILARYPDPSSVPVLLQLAKTDVYLELDERVESADGQDMGMYQIRHLFPDVATALRACSGGEVGRYEGGWTQAKRLVGEWETHWAEHERKKRESGEKQEEPRR